MSEKTNRIELNLSSFDTKVYEKTNSKGLSETWVEFLLSDEEMELLRGCFETEEEEKSE